MDAAIQTFCDTNDYDFTKVKPFIESIFGGLVIPTIRAQSGSPSYNTSPVTKTSSKKKEWITELDVSLTIEQLQSNVRGEQLKEYCRNNGLKIVGSKPDIVQRVFRHLNGEPAEADWSPRSKVTSVSTKASSKAAKEKHSCCGVTQRGQPCSTSAEHSTPDGNWWCWRHKPEITTEPVVVTPNKVVAETKPKTEVVTKPAAVIKPAVKPVVKPAVKEGNLVKTAVSIVKKQEQQKSTRKLFEDSETEEEPDENSAMFAGMEMSED